MKFEVAELRSKGIQAISISHKGKTLKFNTSCYKTASISSRDDMFHHTNEFLARLPEEKKD